MVLAGVLEMNSKTHSQCLECSVGHWNQEGLVQWWRYHHAVQPPTPPSTTPAPPPGFTWSIDSPHFHSRNPSAAYQHSSLSQGQCLFPYPWSWITGVYSHREIWSSAFILPPASKEMCLSGKTAFNLARKHTEYKYIVEGVYLCVGKKCTNLCIVMCISSIVWLVIYLSPLYILFFYTAVFLLCNLLCLKHSCWEYHTTMSKQLYIYIKHCWTLHD